MDLIPFLTLFFIIILANLTFLLISLRSNRKQRSENCENLLVKKCEKVTSLNLHKSRLVVGNLYVYIYTLIILLQVVSFLSAVVVLNGSFGDRLSLLLLIMTGVNICLVLWMKKNSMEDDNA